MKMKKIKLFLMKLEYRANHYIGPIVVNERKYPIFLNQMLIMQNKIEKLQSEIDAEKDR